MRGTVRAQMSEMERCDTASVSGFFKTGVYLMFHVSGTNLNLISSSASRSSRFISWKICMKDLNGWLTDGI
jgi:hypothetical protein